MSNPIKPAVLCWLSPAQGGRFDQASTQVVFWVGDRLGSADLSSGKVAEIGRLPLTPFEGVFSGDGTMFAYRAGDDNVGISTNLWGGGYDRTLYTQEPVGGHGGPLYGPIDQLEFSADGSELLDNFLFRPASGPEKFLVYRTTDILSSSAPSDSFRVFQSTTAAFGVWSPTGGTLYFYSFGSDPSAGQVFSLDSTGQTRSLTTGVSNMFWPRMASDAGSIVYETNVLTGPNDACGGLPHLWRFDLATRRAAQLSSTVSSEPVFVSQRVVWSDEYQYQPGQCEPGGESAPDGVILAYDFVVGGSTSVDMSQSAPGIGAPQPSTRELIDVWF